MNTNARVCPQCGGVHSPNTVICSTCGFQMVVGTANINPNQITEDIKVNEPNPNKNNVNRNFVFCPKCGNEIVAGIRFCPNCGCSVNYSYLANGKNGQLQNQSYNYYNNQPVGVMTYPCPICGNPNAYNATHCPKCGYTYKHEHKINIFGIIGSILYGISVIFPLVSASAFGTTASKSLLEANLDFLLVFVIALFALFFSIIGKDWANLVVGTCACAFAVWEYVNIQENISDNEFGHLITIGAGMYLLFIGAAVIIIGSIINLYIKK